MRTDHGKYYYDFLETVEEMRAEDNSCYICGSTEKVHPHHIRKVPPSNMEYASRSNIVLLCNSHHFRFHQKYDAVNGINRRNFTVFCRKELEREFKRKMRLLKFDILELLNEFDCESPASAEELESRISSIVSGYRKEFLRLKMRDDELKIEKDIKKHNLELNRDNYNLKRQVLDLKKVNEKLKKQNAKLNRKVRAMKYKPGIRQYVDLIGENHELKMKVNNLKGQIDMLKSEMDALQHKNAASRKSGFRKMNYGGWGIIAKYCRGDYTYYKKALLLQNHLKEDIGKTHVTVDSIYVKIFVKNSVSVRQVFDALLLDEDIDYELAHGDNRKVIYFRWND